MTPHAGWLALLLLPMLVRAAAPNRFGEVVTGAARLPIAWTAATGAEIGPARLRLTPTVPRATSMPLPLEPLRHYHLRIAQQRGPGAAAAALVRFTDAAGQPQTRRLVWQSETAAIADGERLPLARGEYLQGIVLPPGSANVVLEFALSTPVSAAQREYHEWEATRLEIVAAAPLELLTAPGSDHLRSGDLESVGPLGLPGGWQVWQASEPDSWRLVAATPEVPAGDGQRFFRLAAGQRAMLIAPWCAVPPGSAWVASFLVRGRGSATLHIHSLDGSRPYPVRVGDAQSAFHSLATPTWVRRQQLWFACAPHLAEVQLVFDLRAESDLDVDAAQFRPMTALPISHP